jgi:hypothetical protein
MFAAAETVGTDLHERFLNECPWDCATHRGTKAISPAAAGVAGVAGVAGGYARSTL